MAKVIGEGTYGCVHKPQLYCNNSRSRKRGKISKLLKKDDAEKELKEYKIMKEIDPDDSYYLGEPMSCDADDGDYNKKSLKDCRSLYKHDANLINSLQKYKLIIMEDGGDSLKKFSRDMEKMEKSEQNKTLMEKFWIEAHRILIGLKVFQENDVVHHDLNNNNIVYNKTKDRINFIDFGLMRRKSKLIEDSKNTKNGFSIYHWSFPPDCRFLNKKIYDKTSNSSESVKQKYYKNIRELNEKTVESKSFSSATMSFLYFVSDDSDFLNQKVITDNILKGFGNTFLNQVKSGGNYYKDYLEKCTSTIDLYGVGLAFLSVLRTTHKFINNKLATDLKELFLRMVDTDLAMRINVDDTIKRYESILTSNGLLEKYAVSLHYSLADKESKSNKPIVVDINKISKSINKESLKESVKEIGKEIEKNEVILEPKPAKVCSEGKEFNPKTNRCIKICKEGFERDENFKCKKIHNKSLKIREFPHKDSVVLTKIRQETRKNKQDNEKGPKICSADKELNPLTNRCVKRCPEGQFRNENFHCRKKKTFKIRKRRITIRT